MTNARRIRALVVDDEPLAREMIREMLEDDSEVEIVSECANGREAVEAIKSLKPDLVFLDIQMPELGGFEVLESLEPHGVGEITGLAAVPGTDHLLVLDGQNRQLVEFVPSTTL